MKKIIIILVIIIIALLCIMGFLSIKYYKCKNKINNYTEKNNKCENLESNGYCDMQIVLIIKHKEYSTGHDYIYFTVSPANGNDDKGLIKLSTKKFEHLDVGKWLKLKSNSVTEELILKTFYIASGETKEQEVNWEPYYNKLSSGKYRIVKEYDALNENGRHKNKDEKRYTTYSYYVEFTIK